MTDTTPGRWRVQEQPITLPPGAANKHSRLTVAHVLLPDGVRFSQVVLRVDPAAMCVLVNDDREALMMRRHRFIPDLDVWELPGGYLDRRPDGHYEDPEAAAAREAEEETGWRPARIEHLCSFQPMTGTADALNHVYLGTYPQPVADAVADVNEGSETRWIPLTDVPAMIAASTLGAASVIGLLAARERLAVR